VVPQECFTGLASSLSSRELRTRPPANLESSNIIRVLRMTSGVNAWPMFMYVGPTRGRFPDSTGTPRDIVGRARPVRTGKGVLTYTSSQSRSPTFKDKSSTHHAGTMKIQAAPQLTHCCQSSQKSGWLSLALGRQRSRFFLISLGGQSTFMSFSVPQRQ
jgi:hypothetical protein